LRGKLRLNIENVHLDNVIHDCFKFKGIELKFINEIEKEGNKLIESDGNRLRQILTNLIGNAIKFTFQDSINVRISE
jgi:signal transduction histidine kinase